MTLTHGSLFSGIGGIDLGFERAGIETIWQCEYDDKASEVLARRFPGVPNLHDVREVRNDGTVRIPDIISGGFPCQDVSVAGPRTGLEGERTTLWSEFARIVREFRPKWVVAENVRGLLSSDNGEFFGNILRDLAMCGYDAEWQTIRASTVGAPHKRERVYIVAYPQRCGLERGCECRVDEESLGYRILTSEAATIPLRRDIWRESTVRIVGVADGFSNRVDRLRQLGNAVVPPIAEWIGRRITEATDDRSDATII
jgi:DNA (cytosine-5)-methyltransferase 1